MSRHTSSTCVTVTQVQNFLRVRHESLLPLTRWRPTQCILIKSTSKMYHGEEIVYREVAPVLMPPSPDERAGFRLERLPESKVVENLLDCLSILCNHHLVLVLHLFHLSQRPPMNPPLLLLRILSLQVISTSSPQFLATMSHF